MEPCERYPAHPFDAIGPRQLTILVSLCGDEFEIELTSVALKQLSHDYVTQSMSSRVMTLPLEEKNLKEVKTKFDHLSQVGPNRIPLS